MKRIIVIDGMDTLQIGRAISNILEGLNGIDNVKLNLDEQSILVEYSRGMFTEEELCDAIGDEGFEVVDIFDA